MDDGERYRFLVEWLDPVNKVKREFLVTYYTSDTSVEMYDRQMKRTFLKRIKCPNLSSNDFYIGNIVNILSRRLLVTGYADTLTTESFTKTLEVSLIIIKQDGFHMLGKILDILYLNGLSISDGRMDKIDSHNIYAKSSFLENLSPKFAVFEVRGNNTMDVLMKLLAMDTMVSVEIKTELGRLSQYCLTANSEVTCRFELNIFFPKPKEFYCNTMVVNNSTACIILPYAIKDGKAGKIIQAIIDANFQISALHVLNFDVASASEFYEVYKGVVSFYDEMVSQLVSGPSIALEIMKESSSDIVQDFRKLAGPYDSVIAKILRSNTLRALYGEDKVKNAVHCTDLSDDGKLEIEYLFYVMPISCSPK